MNYVLVELTANWADEFDINSLWVTTQIDYELFVEKLRKNFVPGQELYFETNEYVDFESVDEILNGIDVIPISDEFYREFIKIIGNTFGMFNLPGLPDRFYKEDEE